MPLHCRFVSSPLTSRIPSPASASQQAVALSESGSQQWSTSMKILPAFPHSKDDDAHRISRYPLFSRRNAMAALLAVSFIMVHLAPLALDQKNNCMIGGICSTLLVFAYSTFRLRNSTTTWMGQRLTGFSNLPKFFKTAAFSILISYEGPHQLHTCILREVIHSAFGTFESFFH